MQSMRERLLQQQTGKLLNCPCTPTQSQDGAKENGITKKIMEFSALDDQLFTVVEDIGFWRLVEHTEPRYTDVNSLRCIYLRCKMLQFIAILFGV